MMNNYGKRLIAVLLALAMTLSLMPMSFAAEESTESDAPIVEQVEELPETEEQTERTMQEDASEEDSQEEAEDVEEDVMEDVVSVGEQEDSIEESTNVVDDVDKDAGATEDVKEVATAEDVVEDASEVEAETGENVEPELETMGDNNDYRDTATVISPNVAYTDNIEVDRDVDYFKVTLPKDGAVSLTLSHAFISSSEDYWEATLMDEGGGEFFTAYWQGCYESQTSQTIGVPAGVYYVKVTHDYWNRSTTPYQLTVNYQSDTLWETEFNGFRTTADELALNTMISGNMKTSGDVDYFKVTLPKDGSVSLTLSHAFISSSENYWKVTLMDEGGEEFFTGGWQGCYKSQTSQTIGVPAGVYYVKVTHDYWNRSTTPYQLTVNYQSDTLWETERNGFTAIADDITVGKPIKGSTYCSGDTDYFKFKISKATKVYLNFEHDMIQSDSSYWRIRILNESENRVDGTYYIAGTKVKAETDHVYLPAGTYYAEVENGSYWHAMPYTLTVKTDNKVNLSECAISLSKTSYTYDGKKKKPTVTVKYGSKKLKLGTDYTVVYSGNTNAGVAKVKITGKGTYTGTATQTFTIAPAKATLSSVKNKATRKFVATWKKVPSASGYEYQYSTYSSMSYPQSLTTTATSYTLTSYYTGRTFYVRVRAYKDSNGQRIYGAWSSVKKVTITK